MDESIIEALEKIQEVCKKQVKCENCLLGDSRGNCLVCMHIPEKWNIKKEPTIRYL